MTAPPEHAPDHPYGTSVGPHGAWMRWCKVDGCDWQQRSSDIAPVVEPEPDEGAA